MNWPRAYPYNPNWRLIAWPFGAGLLSWSMERVLGSGTRWFGVLGTALIAMASLLAARRVYYPRHLVLEVDAMLLPTGFMRVRFAYIPYATITSVSETYLLHMPVLRVRTERGTLEIVSWMLPEAASYIEIAEFLKRRTQGGPTGPR